MALQNLGKIISRTKKTSKFKRGLERAEVFKIARKSVEGLIGIDKNLLDQEIQFEFRGSILTIKCSNSYLAQELRFFQEDLKKKINQRSKDFLIKEIRIRVGRY